MQRSLSRAPGPLRACVLISKIEQDEHWVFYQLEISEPVPYCIRVLQILGLWWVTINNQRRRWFPRDSADEETSGPQLLWHDTQLLPRRYSPQPSSQVHSSSWHAIVWPSTWWLDYKQPASWICGQGHRREIPRGRRGGHLESQPPGLYSPSRLDQTGRRVLLYLANHQHTLGFFLLRWVPQSSWAQTCF